MKRSVHLTIATAMLAGPASAIALTGASAAAGGAIETPSTIHLQVTPRRMIFGQRVTASGRVPRSDAGRTVVLQTAAGPARAWRPVAAGRVGSAGGFRLQAVLRRTGVVRVVDATSASGVPGRPVTAVATGAPAWPATPPRPVTVAAQIRLAPRARGVLGGQAVVVRGRLLPALGHRVVRLQGHFAGGWQTVATARTRGNGAFALPGRIASGLQRRLRVRFAGDRVNAGSIRPAGSVTVYQPGLASWYDDAGSTACGFHAGLGVANVSLPCGTKVGLRYGGRSVTAVVDDRGPYAGGRQWDLNQNTAAALGFNGVGTVWATQ